MRSQHGSSQHSTSTAGAASGSALALAMGPRMESLLFNTSARDPMAFGAAIEAVLIISLVATVLPGVRASRVDPLIALREE